MRNKHLIHYALGGLMALGVATTLGTGTARADLKVTYGQNFFAFGGSNAGSGYQGSVNRNIGSPYYGYLYVADGTLNKIWICPPVKAQDGTGADAYDQDGAPAANPPTQYINVPGGNLTMGVTVGPDDTVWIGSLGVSKVYSAPPVPPSGNSVDAVVQITGVSSVRGLAVTGPVTNAKVYTAGQSPAKVSLYNVVAADASTAGTATNVYSTDFSGAPYNLATGQGAYSLGVDPAGNAYLANGVGATATRLYKIKPDGTVDASFSAVAPAGTPALGAIASASFTEDKSYPGGGYLYFTSMTSTSSAGSQWALRFDLNGNYLDGWGPSVATPPANWSVVTFRGTSQPAFTTSDDLGNLYMRSSATNSGVVKVFKRAPYLAATADATSAGGAVKSSPTAVDGKVYFGSDDGKLYAYDTATGNPVAGFPRDITAAVGEAVKLQGRPGVYTVDGVTRVYFTTNRGDLGRVNADGSDLVVVPTPIPIGENTGTPAVTSDGTIYVGGSTALGAGVLKVDKDMTGVEAFQALGPATATVSSVAVYGNSVYVGLDGGTGGDIVVLKTSDLTPQAAGVATGEGVTAPPYVSGSSAYVGTQAGNFYKVNSVTFAPDSTFGAGGSGKAAIGEGLPGSAFNEGNTFYVGSDHGKVWQIDGATGAFSVLYNTGDTSLSIPGVVVNRAANTLAFGVNEVLPASAANGGSGAATGTGLFYQVPTNVTSGPVNAQVFRGYGDFNSTPTYDSASKRFLIGSDDGNVYAFSSR